MQITLLDAWEFCVAEFQYNFLVEFAWNGIFIECSLAPCSKGEHTYAVTLNTEIRYLIRRKKITTYVKGENLTNFLGYNKMQNARIDETKNFYFDEVSERAENVKE